MNFSKGPHYIEDMKDLLGDGIFAVDGVKLPTTRHTNALHDVLKNVCAKNRSMDLYKLISCYSTEVFTDMSFGRLTVQRFLQLDIKEIDAAVLSIVQQVLANRALTPEDERGAAIRPRVPTRRCRRLSRCWT
ncbi:uncharacterized protein PITG_14020 [Phytophthora infestans T30-4]|uniref:Uncharacterized protein n=1 Tax=Phytophthora infestans (strain T30-4) TaxID=403677 RepID=D0NNC2_PHYIT|nr:uncharacterized protein PITG_14020 [Phytophthora infestans T30-4]EEY62029.1 conserved hypothetical protein [Phytophthora infestans T30-4]|eukprot:XP_002899669.1 conserved hypothetical protein [Phytophthora infestans T30-4]